LSLVVLTGYSGAGKSTAANALEDLGYYTIDNLPLLIIDKFVQVMLDFNVEIPKVALVIDIRSKDIQKTEEIISLLKSKHSADIIFLEASDETLIKRYKETRRTHPLGGDVIEAIKKEKVSMENIKEMADFVIDTSNMTVHELVRSIEEYFKDASSAMYITVQSFGFKYGIPPESDLVFDVRFLKNPHFEEGLRAKTGLDDDVYNFVFSDKRMKEFLRKLKSFLSFLLPNYMKEGKKFLTLSFGCTGGRHRSVAIAKFIGDYIFKKTSQRVYIKHRDINRS
jgi:UPF0042 nucleotide-binding protein